MATAAGRLFVRCLFVCHLSICLFVCLSVCLFVCLSGRSIAQIFYKVLYCVFFDL